MKNNIDFTCKVTFKYSNGLKCNLSSGFISFGKCDIKISGSKGIIRVPATFHNARKAKIVGRNGQQYVDTEKIQLYERELTLVSNEIMEGKKISSYVSDVDSINVMKIMETIKKQIKLEYPNDKE